MMNLASCATAMQEITQQKEARQHKPHIHLGINFNPKYSLTFVDVSLHLTRILFFLNAAPPLADLQRSQFLHKQESRLPSH